MQRDFPSRWSQVEIGHISQIVGGGTPPSKDESCFATPGHGVAWLTPADLSGYRGQYITRGARDLSSKGLASCSAKLMPSGAVLFSSRAPVGYVAIAAQPLATSQGFKSFVLPDGVDSRFAYYQLRHLKPVAEGMATGTTFKELSGSAAARIPFLVAPPSEQRRIADKLDTVLARVDAVNDRLARVAPLLKRFRQAVLAAATSGKLTEDWRSVQGPGVPGQARMELDQLLKGRRGLLKVRGEAARVPDELLFEVPSTWSWVKNYELAEDLENAICAGPFGTIFKAKDFRDDGVPIVFLRHVAEGEYLTHKPTYMDRQVWQHHHQPYSVRGGELLVTKLGDPPGTACLYPKKAGIAMVTPDVLKMEVCAAASDAKYLMHFFNSPIAKNIVRAMCFGVTRLRIDIAMFKTFPVPLPPRAEQAEIVRRVDLLFGFADRLEARLQAAQTAADRLTPALLAKAFRGELVPQDPNDEPASELLKRLAAQRAQAGSTPARTRGLKPAAHTA